MLDVASLTSADTTLKYLKKIHQSYQTVMFYLAEGSTSINLTGLKGTLKNAFVVLNGIGDGDSSPTNCTVTLTWDSNTIMAAGTKIAVANFAHEVNNRCFYKWGNGIGAPVADVTDYVTLDASNSYELTYAGGIVNYGGILVITYAMESV